jgi:hypothetical protein
MSAATAISLAGTVASTGMGIIGSATQANGMRQAGQIAVNNAIMRNEQAKAIALRAEADAKAYQAAGQRKAIEAVRKGSIMASRAQAVMAASGAGIDPKLIARLMGEGEYGKDLALYGGDEKARVMRDKARMSLWSGATGIDTALSEQQSMNARADSTMTTGIIGAGLSLASKYGGDIVGAFGGGGSPASQAGPTGARSVDPSELDLA